MGREGPRKRVGGRVAALALAIGIVAVSAARSDALVDAGVCARCHGTQTLHAAVSGGHAVVLDCTSCHQDRRPGRVGARHRAIPNCADCHEAPGHPSRPRSGRRATRNCLACHDVHGSTNLSLVRTDLRWRRRITQVTFTNEDGAVAGGFTNPTAPGSGLCEVCHRTTDFYRRNGSGEPHYGEQCTLCHDHAHAFGVVVSETNCGICHTPESDKLAMPSSHSPLACGTCHAEVSPNPGPGHRAAEACETCHDAGTHAPAGRPPLPCTQCHDPHGSANTSLVLEQLTTTAGAAVPIRFDDLHGRVDGSFASASAPGTGICEVCHTTTRFYRADGGGDSHFTFSCQPCHTHAAGFAPP
ncbi:MAG: cytochrome c3 family protein [Candidatus Binatia bacterium]